MIKTIYLPIGKQKLLSFNLSDYPNAGPHPSVSGMRSKYWGIDALVVRSGVYAYHLPEKEFLEAYKLIYPFEL